MIGMMWLIRFFWVVFEVYLSLDCLCIGRLFMFVCIRIVGLGLLCNRLMMFVLLMFLMILILDL